MKKTKTIILITIATIVIIAGLFIGSNWVRLSTTGNIVKENENGFILDDFDKKRYVKRIHLIKDDVNLRVKMFETNVLLAKNYTWDNVARHITQIMEKTLYAKN